MCSVMRSTRTTLFTALLTVSLSISPRSAALAAAPSESPPAQDTSTAAPSNPPADAPEQADDPTPANQDTGDGALPLLPEETQPADTDNSALPLLPDPETPGIARDLRVEELPLLVTEPPEEQDEVAIPAPVTGGSDSTLNPFSPLLPPQAAEPVPPAAPPVAAEPPAPAPTSAPTSAQPPPAATSPAEPTPSAATPAAPVPPARAGRPALPRSFGASLRAPASAVSNLSASPLGRALDVQSVGEDDDDPESPPSSSIAAIRAPSSLTPLGTAPTATAAAAPIPSSAQQVALGSGLSTLGLGSRAGASDGNFTSLGGNRVSRALSSLQVHFTAMATGTAIFRVGNDTMPVLLALGESLPGTELKLTSLTSQGAEFTEDDVRHTLFLTP